MILTIDQIKESIKDVEKILEIIPDNTNGDEMSVYLSHLLSIQSSISLMESSAKYHYLKDKKNAEYNFLYTHCTNLMKNVHYAISGVQSVLRYEMSKINNKI